MKAKEVSSAESMEAEEVSSKELRNQPNSYEEKLMHKWCHRFNDGDNSSMVLEHDFARLRSF
jgi:hypothetical protein